MSRLAKKPILIPEGVTVTQTNGELLIKGPKGEKLIKVLDKTEIVVTEKELTIKSLASFKQARSNWGTMASLIKNAIEGTTKGFIKILEIEGVGFRAALDGKTLVLSLGFVNPVRFEAPQGISIELEKNTVKISGVDKEVVGQAAAQIRSFKKPEPYKGKGIRYRGEVIKIKVGKKAAGASA